MCMWEQIPMKSRGGNWIPGNGVTGRYELPDMAAGNWNPGPLQDQYMLIATEPSLQAHLGFSRVQCGDVSYWHSTAFVLIHLHYRNHGPTDMLCGLLSLVTRPTIWFNDSSWLDREAPCRLIKHTSVCTCETLLETVIGEIKIYPKCERRHALVWDSNRIQKERTKSANSGTQAALFYPTLLAMMDWDLPNHGQNKSHFLDLLYMLIPGEGS